MGLKELKEQAAVIGANRKAVAQEEQSLRVWRLTLDESMEALAEDVRQEGYSGNYEVQDAEAFSKLADELVRMAAKVRER